MAIVLEFAGPEPSRRLKRIFSGWSNNLKRKEEPIKVQFIMGGVKKFQRKRRSQTKFNTKRAESKNSKKINKSWIRRHWNPLFLPGPQSHFILQRKKCISLIKRFPHKKKKSLRKISIETTSTFNLISICHI